MMGKYAATTKVTVAQSQAEIQRVLRRYGAADSFVSGWANGQVTVLFEAQGRRVRFDVPMPDAALPDNKYAQQERQRWRALLLVIKSKLESIDTGITSFEEEFLAHFVTPDGTTIGQQVIPRLTHDDWKLPPLLTGPRQ